MKRIATVAAALLLGGAVAHVQQPETAPRAEKPENYSPLGFEDLRAYQQAFPATPGTLAVARAVRLEVLGLPRHRLPRLDAGAGPGLGEPRARRRAFRIRRPAAAARRTFPDASRRWRSRRRAGSKADAASGSARPAAACGAARTRCAPTTRGGGGSARVSAPTTSAASRIDPNDESGDTIYVGTGETNAPQNSGAGTGLYRSTDGGDRWTRVPTNILDTTVSPSPIDFTSTRGISSIAVEPGSPRTIYVATTTAMLGMSGGPRRAEPDHGIPAAARRPLQDGRTAATRGRCSGCRRSIPSIPANPNRSVGAGDTMIGVRLVKLDPKDPRIVYATAFNNAIHRSAPSLEGGDASFKPVFAIVGAGRFQDLAMFDLTVSDRHTRIYAYNGTLDTATQALYRLDNADVPASTAGHRQRRLADQHGASGRISRRSRPTDARSRRALASVRQSVLLRSGRGGAGRPAGHGDHRWRAVAVLCRADAAVHQRRTDVLRLRDRRADPAGPQPRRRPRRRLSPEERQHCVRRIRRRRRAQRRHVHERHAAAASRPTRRAHADGRPCRRGSTS